MFIPLIEKDPAADDFTCRDGEIEFMTGITGDGGDGDSVPPDTSLLSDSTGYGVRFALDEAGDYPTATVRVPLQDGDKEKATLMLQGQISRVDAGSADRITGLIVSKAADAFSSLVIDRRRRGLHLLPFRVYALIEQPDGTLRHPSAQAVMLPCETPPHPEITASSVTDDTLTLHLRWGVRPHRMRVVAPDGLPAGGRVVLYVSYPLYIPAVADISGTLGSVRSATGEGNATGIRFSFLSESNMKYSVAAPEKYYRLTGNENTGYHMSSKAAEPPDYTSYAADFGYVPPFPADALVRQGSGADPLDWVADWERHGGGVLPMALPYIYRSRGESSAVVPGGVDPEWLDTVVSASGLRHVLLTRPMTFADAGRSRRKAEQRGVARMRIHGLPPGRSVAVLLGSSDGVRYEPLRRFDPRLNSYIFSPPRLFHRLLLLADSMSAQMALEVSF